MDSGDLECNECNEIQGGEGKVKHVIEFSVRITGTRNPNFTKFSVRVNHGRGLVLLWRRCDTLCISGLVDDVIFSHTGHNPPIVPGGFHVAAYTQTDSTGAAPKRGGV